MNKVCMCVGYYPIRRGGAEHQAYIIAEELRRQHNVFFISLGNFDGVLEDNGYRVYTLKPPSFASQVLYFFLWKKILRILDIEQPDIIYQGVCFSATGIVAYYCKRNNAKMVWHIESDPDVEHFKFELRKATLSCYVEKKIAEYGIKNADYIIAQTEIQNHNLMKHYRRSCDVIMKNCHPVPCEKLDKSLPLTVVWIANIKKLKQPELFLDLCEVFKGKREIRFIMIGKPALRKYQDKLDSKIRGLAQLTFTGELPIEEVNKILARSHIFVNTSLYEGFPNTFIQAWMRQVPVVSLNVDPDNMLKEYGIGFHSKTFEQMIFDLETLLQDSPLRDKMGKIAQRVAFDHFLPVNIRSITRFFE